GSEALYGSSLYVISEGFYKLDPKNMLKPKPRVYTNEKIEKIETYAVVKPLKNNLKDMLSKMDSNVNGNSVNY
ncbi:4640_t:CDS:1, partial [Rhizophagus irregularis]